MKKILIFTLTLVIIIISACNVFIFAGSSTIESAEAPYNSVDIDVYGCYIDSTDIVYAPVSEEGEAELELPDGKRFKVTNAPEDAVTFAVMPVDKTKEQEAFDWFEESLEDKGSEIVPFYIFFVDENGDRIGPNGADVTTTASASHDDPIVLSLNPNGESDEIGYTKESANEISFEMNESPYYIIANKPPKDPQTGDITWIYFFISLFALVMTCAIVFVSRRRRVSC